MSDVGTYLKRGAETLASAGIESPWREARLLLLHTTDLTEAELIGYPERSVAAVDDFDRLIRRRAKREPLSHLLGQREFWSLTFEVTAETLDPRPDSETIIEAVLDNIQDTSHPFRILDLGTGTGCLLSALLSECPHAWGVGVERDAAAAQVATRNLKRLGLASRGSIVVADWTAPLNGKFDLIVTNPPYIPSAELAGLQQEVREHDPALALDGGHDGLTIYRALIPRALAGLAAGGRLLLEVGLAQQQVGLVPVRLLLEVGRRQPLPGPVQVPGPAFEPASLPVPVPWQQPEFLRPLRLLLLLQQPCELLPFQPRLHRQPRSMLLDQFVLHAVHLSSLNQSNPC